MTLVYNFVLCMVFLLNLENYIGKKTKKLIITGIDIKESANRLIKYMRQ